MDSEEIILTNKTYWNDHTDLQFCTTVLSTYRVCFPTEDYLYLFGDIANKEMLEICCGSGHSLKYNADRGAGELWALTCHGSILKSPEKPHKINGFMAKYGTYRTTITPFQKEPWNDMVLAI